MKSFAISTALIALATGVIADNCSGGLAYCSSTLLQKGKTTLTKTIHNIQEVRLTLQSTGNYEAQINEALSIAKQTNPQDTDKALFFCEGGSNGNIVFTTSCANGCVDGGSGNDDFCAA